MKEETSIPASRLWLVLARAYNSMAGYVERYVAGQGLGLSDFMVLEALLHKGPLTISAIGQKVLLASASMTSAIDRLERRALVRRTFDAKDRRVRMVELTPEGEQLITALYAEHEVDLERIAAGLSGNERREMYEGLKRLGFAAEAATKAGRP